MERIFKAKKVSIFFFFRGGGNRGNISSVIAGPPFFLSPRTRRNGSRDWIGTALKVRRYQAWLIVALAPGDRLSRPVGWLYNKVGRPEMMIRHRCRNRSLIRSPPNVSNRSSQILYSDGIILFFFSFSWKRNIIRIEKYFSLLDFFEIILQRRYILKG